MVVTYAHAHGAPEDSGVYPVSRFQSLCYALEDEDQERAAAEWKDLVAQVDPEHPNETEAQRAEKLAHGFRLSLFRPFTGNRKMDKAFEKDASAEDRAVIEKATASRSRVWQDFAKVHISGIRVSQETADPE